MKRLIMLVLTCLVAGCALAGTGAGSASATSYHCLATFWGQYKKDGAVGEQCKEYGVLPIYSWDLYATNTAKAIATGVLCALVEPPEISLYDGPNCASSEEHKGEGEWDRALDIEERFYGSAEEKLLSTKVQTQVFTTEEGTVECTEAVVAAGTSSTAATTSQSAELKYGKCTAFGFVSAEISPADYAFQANGEVHIEKLIKFFAPALGCEVSVPAQSAREIKYDDNDGSIELLPKVTGILYTANSKCTKPGEFKNGTYAGNSEVMIAKGGLAFVP
jgi:hypothetical protein